MNKMFKRSKGDGRLAVRAAVESLESRQLLSVSFDTYLIQPQADLTPVSSAADSKGNVYVLGTFSGKVDFNPAAKRRFIVDGASGSGDPSYFVAKYSAKGGLYWVLPFRGTSELTTPGFDAIAVDSHDNFYLSGTLDGAVDADPGRHVRLRSPETDSDVIVMKFREDTKLLGATVVTLAGNAADDATQLKIDSAGYVYVGGTYTDASSSDTLGYLAKISARGKVAWWNNTADAQDGVVLGIDRNQNPVLVGQSRTSASMAINRFNQDGRFVSRQPLTTSASSAGAITPIGVDFDAHNNPLVAGNMTGFADFDTTNAAYVLGPKLATDPSSNIFFAKYTPQGKLKLARLIGSTGTDQAAGVSIDRTTGNFYIAGSFDGPVDFDPGRSGVFVLSTGRHALASDMFVATFTDLGAFLNAAQLNAPNSVDTAVSFSLAPSGRVYVLGSSADLNGSSDDAISLFNTIR
jgi:hypothetical protein